MSKSTDTNVEKETPDTSLYEEAFKAGFSYAWDMGGYGDYLTNESASWAEFKKGLDVS
jgi:hypothetical protein